MSIPGTRDFHHGLLATKQDIAEITRRIEGVKADYARELEGVGRRSAQNWESTSSDIGASTRCCWSSLGRLWNFETPLQGCGRNWITWVRTNPTTIGGRKGSAIRRGIA